jgi:hypothetical protein
MRYRFGFRHYVTVWFGRIEGRSKEVQRMANVSELLGKTVIDITKNNDDELIFKTDGGNIYKMFHYQDCCETVQIEEIIGNLADLINSPILMAEEVSQEDENADESGTWTFYKFATLKGYVTIRWYGSSSGYYSESVDFEEVKF